MSNIEEDLDRIRDRLDRIGDTRSEKDDDAGPLIYAGFLIGRLRKSPGGIGKKVCRDPGDEHDPGDEDRR